MHTRRRFFLCSLLLTVATSVPACDPVGDVTTDEDRADDPGADEGEAPVDSAARPDLVPGGVLEVGALDVIVPAAGASLHAEALLEDGTAQVIALETDDDGAVWELIERPLLDGSGEVELQALGPCSDGAHSLLPWRWNHTFAWRYNAGSTPSYLSAGAVEGALRDGTNAITQSWNDCGLVDLVGATHRYLGHTSRPMGGLRACGGPNGESSAAFGPLRPGVLAVTCTYARAGSAHESDLRFNYLFRWFAGAPSGCAGAYSILGVTAHERGHTFGLGHAAPQASHAALTMSPGIGPCTTADLTLGLGDVRGLRQKY